MFVCFTYVDMSHLFSAVALRERQQKFQKSKKIGEDLSLNLFVS